MLHLLLFLNGEREGQAGKSAESISPTRKGSSSRNFGARGQLILINLVPSGDFSGFSRLKFARVEKERARGENWLAHFQFPLLLALLRLPPKPKRSHKGEHRSYKNERAGERASKPARSGVLQSGAERWVGKIKLERPGSQAGRQAEKEMKKWNNTYSENHYSKNTHSHNLWYVYPTFREAIHVVQLHKFTQPIVSLSHSTCSVYQDEKQPDY